MTEISTHEYIAYSICPGTQVQVELPPSKVRYNFDSSTILVTFFAEAVYYPPGSRLYGLSNRHNGTGKLNSRILLPSHQFCRRLQGSKEAARTIGFKVGGTIADVRVPALHNVHIKCCSVALGERGRFQAAGIHRESTYLCRKLRVFDMSLRGIVCFCERYSVSLKKESDKMLVEAGQVRLWWSRTMGKCRCLAFHTEKLAVGRSYLHTTASHLSWGKVGRYYLAICVGGNCAPILLQSSSSLCYYYGIGCWSTGNVSNCRLFRKAKELL